MFLNNNEMSQSHIKAEEKSGRERQEEGKRERGREEVVFFTGDETSH